MGSTVVRGETEGTVEYTGVNTFFGKTAALLASTEELSNVQLLLIMIVRNLTILSLVMCAIVSRLAAIEDTAGMAILCSDKTGTLTLNEMHIQEYTPVYTEGMNRYELLRLAACAAKWHEPARDALDKLVLGCDTNPNGVDLKSM